MRLWNSTSSNYKNGRRWKNGTKNIHVIKNNDAWQVKREGSQRASKNFDTQKEAIQYAIPGTKKDHVEVVIHGRDGKIRDKDSYGNDPIPPRDRKY